MTFFQLDEILKGEFTNDTKSQLSAALADLVEATTPPDDRSSLYAQVNIQSTPFIHH